MTRLLSDVTVWQFCKPASLPSLTAPLIEIRDAGAFCIADCDDTAVIANLINQPFRSRHSVQKTVNNRCAKPKRHSFGPPPIRLLRLLLLPPAVANADSSFEVELNTANQHNGVVIAA